MNGSRRYSHTLIVGGTGMLRSVSVEFATRSKRLTSIARTWRSLLSLDAVLVGSGCIHHMLALDWNVPDHFLAEIERHIASTEPPELIVAWMHSDHLMLSASYHIGPNRPSHALLSRNWKRWDESKAHTGGSRSAPIERADAMAHASRNLGWCSSGDRGRAGTVDCGRSENW